MKAAPQDQKALLDLQALDTRLAQIAHTLSNLPQRDALAELAVTLDEIRRRHAQKQGEIDDGTAELTRVESDVQVVEARAARDAQRLEASASLKDIQALEAEVAALSKRRADLEEIELSVMERLEQLEAEQATIRAEKDEAESRYAALDGEKADREAALHRERDEVLADREAVSSAIPTELVELYERQRQRYGIGAAALVQGVSRGSNVKLTPSDMDVVRRAAPDDVVLCPDSGCVLVRDENSGL